MNDIKVSVIIPVYNVEKYLRQCLDSVKSQTLLDIEFICVDDGSTDASATILDDYAKVDNRFKIIHKKNEGYGKAMNTGMDAAAGEYIGIVESDDMVYPDTYEILYNSARRNDLDMVKGDHDLFYGEEEDEVFKSHPGNCEAWYDKVMVKGMSSFMYPFPMSIWTGIYKRSFLTQYGIRFRESPGASFQDNGFWLKTVAAADRMMFISRSVYRYRQDNPDASIRSTDKMYAMTEEYDDAVCWLRNNGFTGDANIANYYRMRELRVTYYRIDDILKEKFAEEIRKQFREFKGQFADLDCTEEVHFMPWIYEMAGDPYGTNTVITVTRKKVTDFLAKKEHLMVYGAGYIASRVFRKLVHLGVWDKVSYIITSDEPEKKVFCGKKVVSVDRVKSVMRDEEFLVLIAAGRRSQPDMLKRLVENDISDYMVCDDLLKEFWTII